MTLVYTGQTIVVAVLANRHAKPVEPESKTTSESSPAAKIFCPKVKAGNPGTFVVVSTIGVAVAVAMATEQERITVMRAM